MSDQYENFVEEFHSDSFSMRYECNKKLFSGKSDFQKVEVVDTKGFGKMLLNDDLVMLTERDEFVYHDMISHVPLFIHPNPKRVLVVGGGDGGTVREVLRHENVEKCYLVEIDAMVVDACREFIPQTSSILSDPRVEVLIEDGVKFMAEHKDTFDVIIIDSTDPIGPATPLFGKEFYQNVLQRLSPEGIVVAQGESPFYDSDMQHSMLTIVSDLFPISKIYNFSNLTYPGGLWSFVLGSKKYDPVKDFDAQRVIDSKLDFEYYNAGVHTAAFSLPNFMLKKLAKFISQ